MSQDSKSPLMLGKQERIRLWQQTTEAVEAYLEGVEHLPVTPNLDPKGMREVMASFRFERGQDPESVLDFVVSGFRNHQVHTPHPHYYGLFNPAPTPASIAGDTLVAAFNPQLAAWSHNPFAQEVENHLIDQIGSRFGLENPDGTFCSGGAEANHTALLTALAEKVPGYLNEGLQSLEKKPVFYASDQSHHSFLKAARCCGLGQEALRPIPLTSRWRMDADAFRNMLRADKQAGFHPFMVVATAGTTNAGIIDPLNEFAQVAKEQDLWFHVDAAWGGAGVFLEELKPHYAGMERADSITFDAHKWMSVPMGAGMFFTPHRQILSRTFTTEAGYMPKDAEGLDITDPYNHSLQWSRRHIGMKLFFSLSVAGWPGYEQTIRHQVAMGNYLKERLWERNWNIVVETPLPVVCFTQGPGQADLFSLTKIIRTLGPKAWLSTTQLDANTPVLRACITNFRTEKNHIDALIEMLEEARAAG